MEEVGYFMSCVCPILATLHNISLHFIAFFLAFLHLFISFHSTISIHLPLLSVLSNAPFCTNPIVLLCCADGSRVDEHLYTLFPGPGPCGECVH
jgi:hypothetical protein